MKQNIIYLAVISVLLLITAATLLQLSYSRGVDIDNKIQSNAERIASLEAVAKERSKQLNTITTYILENEDGR